MKPVILHEVARLLIAPAVCTKVLSGTVSEIAADNLRLGAAAKTEIWRPPYADWYNGGTLHKF